jgi:hypothetical protein
MRALDLAAEGIHRTSEALTSYQAGEADQALAQARDLSAWTDAHAEELAAANTACHDAG